MSKIGNFFVKVYVKFSRKRKKKNCKFWRSILDFVQAVGDGGVSTRRLGISWTRPGNILSELSHSGSPSRSYEIPKWKRSSCHERWFCISLDLDRIPSVLCTLSVIQSFLFRRLSLAFAAFVSSRAREFSSHTFL